MSINTDFYGSENDWIALSNDTPDLFKTAYPYNNDATYQGSLKALQESSITNPDNVASPILDDSIIPWKINEKSDVFNQKYIYPYCTDYINPQQSTWMYQSSDYTQNVNGGFRFFIQDANYTNGNNGTNGVWVYRYSPLNTKGQLDEGLYRRLFPIVGFDYSKCYVQISLLYVPKSAFDDITQSWNTANVNSISIEGLINDNSKWENNYFYGIQYQLRYKDLTGNAHSLGLFAYDKIKASPYSGGYYPYGEDFHHYQTAMTTVRDTGQMGRCSIGGIVGGTGNAFTIRWDSKTHTDIIELFKKNYDDTHCLRHMGGLKDGEQIVFNRKSGANDVRLIPYRTYDSDSKQDFIDYARKQAAYLGFPFSDSAYNMIDNPDKTYIPEINASGVTTGNYALANTQPEYINAEWTTDVYSKTPYNPENDKADDPNTYDNNTTNLNYIRNIGVPFGHEYIMTQQQVIDLRGELYSTISTDIDSDIWAQQNFLVNNPMDVIKSLMFYPFDILSATGYSGVATNISLGKIQTSAQGIESPSDIIDIDMGKCTYFPYFGQNDFRNFKPYSSAELFIPYCGTVEIEPELFMNQEISVKMLVDLKTGSCLSLIYRNNMVVDFATGQIGISVPISGIQAQTLASAERQAQSQLKMARISALTNVANIGLSVGGASMTGGLSLGALPSTISGLMNNYENIENAKYNLEHINTPYKSKGTSTALTSFVNEQQCRLVIKRPVMDENNLAEYSHNNGYAVLKNDVLNNFSGFTKCDTADLSGIDCTKSEKNLIMNHLRNGVYL
jgi:hypothetical protein